MSYGVSDEEALGVGLMCGGTVRVFVAELEPAALEVLDAGAEARAAGRPAAMATLLEGDGAGRTLAVAADGVAGGIGYEVTICDAREPFIRSPRFSAHAETVVDWPDRYLAGVELGPRDVVLVFTHDPKFDEPALTAALESGAGYVGALGSRRTQERRLERLREAGLDESSIAGIHAPCGLDVGARTPAETAVSILAEVVAVRAGRSGEPLRETGGPIHPTEAGAEAATEATAGGGDH